MFDTVVDDDEEDFDDDADAVDDVFDGFIVVIKRIFLTFSFVEF